MESSPLYIFPRDTHVDTDIEKGLTSYNYPVKIVKKTSRDMIRIRVSATRVHTTIFDVSTNFHLVQPYITTSPTNR